jgi:hypothetical protein
MLPPAALRLRRCDSVAPSVSFGLCPNSLRSASRVVAVHVARVQGRPADHLTAQVDSLEHRHFGEQEAVNSSE